MLNLSNFKDWFIRIKPKQSIMRTINVFTGALALFFLTSASITFAQTKNAATDKLRQANIEKIEKKEAKQKAAYNNMTKGQKATARAKALEHKTGGNKANPPAISKGANPAQGKVVAAREKGLVNAKPINVPKVSKPKAIWQTPKTSSKAAPTKPPIKPSGVQKNTIDRAKTPVNNTSSTAISAKPSTNAEASDKNPVSATKPDVQKPDVKSKSATPAVKATPIDKDRK